ncbi:GbsR/MarR family transcriptional regulator [Galbibacter sp.]|jgi:DNA-binding transcriptional regulator GbsR (MarR family)|uniref:GbsR/MarR family transcriptional regulator n=1 Tax=Galbibacter sp. TaxID=2918471 RepID=UPI003A8FDFDF
MADPLELIKVKKQLIEEMGVYFESQDILSPLSSRIFAFLALAGNSGATFDEIVEELEVSKSSVSTNLQLLQTMGRVGYYTKSGDRRRYFKIAENNMVNRLDDKVASWEREKVLHVKVLEYKKLQFEHNSLTKEEQQREMGFSIHYIEFLESMIENLKKLKNNLLITINQEQK